MANYDKVIDSQMTTSSEADLLELVGDQHNSFILFIQNLTASETILLKVYFWDEVSSTYQLYSSDSISGTDPEKAKHFAFTFTSKLKATIQRTAGTDKQINFMTVQVDP
jgi:hypothetical protein